MTINASNGGDAATNVSNAAAKAGISLKGLDAVSALQLLVANLYLGGPTTEQIPAGDVLSGTFGANKAGGADSGKYTFPGAADITGALGILAGALATSPTLGIGYATGAGGSVTQTSNRSATVSLSTVVGTIVGQGTSLAANTSASFTVLNTVVAINDVIILNVQSGPTANTSIFTVAAVAAGSFVIRCANLSGSTADTGAPTLNFLVLKGVAS